MICPICNKPALEDDLIEFYGACHRCALVQLGFSKSLKNRCEMMAKDMPRSKIIDKT